MQTTHFGFEEVSVTEKTQRVAEVFDTVADRYDLMNDLMSFGLHRLWKQYLFSQAGIKSGHKVLDIAGGTGDIAKGFLKRVGPDGLVYLADINNNMLKVGRDKLINQGYLHNLFYIQANAESLPFQENYFDRISIGFGLRNVTDKEKALRSMWRVLKPGGCLLILEFSKPILPLIQKIYDKYSFSVLAKIEDSYRYLVESIRQHPDQESLKQLILDAGFDQCDYTNLTGGIVCLHKAYKT